MKVRELINKLLDCKMDAEVVVLVEIGKETIRNAMVKYGEYLYPLDDEIEIKNVEDSGTIVRIELGEFKR